MNEEKYVRVYVDAKTLEVLDVLSDWANVKIGELASLLLAHSAVKLTGLYRIISAKALGGDL